MATATRRRKAAPVEVEPEVDEIEELTEDEVDEDEDIEEVGDEDEDELEELTDEEEEEAAPQATKKTAKKSTSPAKKTTSAKAATSGFDSRWLATHVSSVTDKDVDSRALRVLLRKLAKDDTFTPLQRVVGTDRIRYEFPGGANDPVVKKVIAMVKSGALDVEKSAGLEKARAAKAAKTAAAAAPAKTAPAKKTTAKATPAKKATRARAT